MTGRAVVLLAVLSLGAGVAACGGDDDAGTTPSTTSAPASTTTAPATTSSTEEPAVVVEVRAYLLRDERVAPAAREATDRAVATEAVRALLRGPTEAETAIGLTTAIPAGTELLGIDIDERVATVDLSAAFTSGGGSASMLARVAQVVFTATQFPTVDAVLVEVEGDALTALGGEGLVLEGPQARADWEDLTPAILVESPLPFAEVRSPLRITGTANTFEAAFQVNVVDGDGLIVYDRPAMATSGTGTRGTFDVTATFDVPRPGAGAVIVFEASAEDGRPVNIVEVPVQVAG